MLFAHGAWSLVLIVATTLCAARYAIGQPPQAVYNQTSLWCADVAAKALLLSCDSETQDDTFIRIVARNFTACVENNGTQQPSLQPIETQVTQVMVPTHMYATYRGLAEQFVADRQLQLAVVPVDVDQLQLEAEFEFSNKLSSSHHAWIMYLDSYYPLEQYSGILDLTNLTNASGAAQSLWGDLPAGFVNLSYSYYGLAPTNKRPRVMSLPLGASTPLMYYVPEALARHNLTAPRTWSEVLYAAAKINGTDVNEDGTLDYALCFRPDPDCSYASALGMVLTPYLQYKGTSQGAFLRPLELEPLFDNAGARRALEVFAGLMQYHTSLLLEGEDCLTSATARAFVNFDCAMTFGWGDVFKMSEVMDGGGSPNRIKGRYSVAPLPGSEAVFDRDLMQLVPCTGELCPFGVDNRREQIVLQQDNTTAYVNRAPYLPYSGLVGVVSSEVDPAMQQVAFDFLVFLADKNKELALSPNNLIMPYHTSLLNSSDAALLAEFEAAGFDRAPTAAYMTTTLSTLQHGNLVPGPLIPREEALRALLAVAAANLSYGLLDADAVSQELQVNVRAQMVDVDSSSSWRAQLSQAYWDFIGYTPETPRGDPTGGRGLDMPAVSLAVPVASALVVLVASTLYEFKKHRQHRSLFGKVVAPGPFEDTTLLVTDIQDSTALWEMLPSSVMDRAIKEHHACLRKLLLKHSGYESATEGDSFLLAFHCPEDALLFAMESQVALLECAWPMELLDCDVCRPYYVVHNDSDKRANLIADGADAAGSLMALPRTNSGLSNKSTSEDTSSPQASNALGAPGSEVNTFITACQASWKEATATTPNNVLIFRGLRVRMGMHTGITNEADVAYNKAAARMQYSGEILQYGKAVSDAAAGGMILLSEAAYRRLPMERLWDKAMVMHVGEYKLKDDLPVLPLYQVTGRRLMGRLGYLSGMRFKEQLSKGVFTAPLGAVAMAYLGIVGIPALLAWDEAVTREALAQLHGCVAELSHKWGGYMAESGDEQMHVVFSGAGEALLWALAVHQALMELPWPDPLLEHELAEELIVGDVVVFRGLRVKSGVDVGHAVGEVNALTGRICYRGKVVSRAARVMQSASSNQVLASGEAWASAQAASAGLLQLRGIVGDRLGPFKLRGVADRVEMVQVRLQRPDVAGADGWAQDLQLGGGTAAPAAEGAEGSEGGAADGGGGGAIAGPSRPVTASHLAAVAAGGAEEPRPVSAPRGFGFLGRNSRTVSTPALVASASARSATAVAAAAASAAAGGGAAGQSGGPEGGGGAAASGLQLSASPRLFGSLRLFGGGGSNRAQSFTAGLLHRMAQSRRGAGIGVSGGGGGTGGGGGGAAGPGTGVVDASSVSIIAAAAATGTATGTATPTLSVARESAAETAGSTASGAATPLFIGALAAASGGPGGASASMPVLAAAGGSHSGTAPNRAASSNLSPAASNGPTAAGPTSPGSLNILRGFRVGNSSARGGNPPAASQPFPFPSARRLLPSSWNLGGGSGGGGGGLLSAAGSPAGGGLHGSSYSTMRTSADLSGLASMVATSLPASRSHAHVGSAAAVTATAPDAADAATTSAVAGPAAGSAGGAAIAAAAGAAAGGAAPDGGGWYPGEMLADVLQGVQEEDELSGAGLPGSHREQVSQDIQHRGGVTIAPRTSA